MAVAVIFETGMAVTALEDSNPAQNKQQQLREYAILRTLGVEYSAAAGLLDLAALVI